MGSSKSDCWVTSESATYEDNAKGKDRFERTGFRQMVFVSLLLLLR